MLLQDYYCYSIADYYADFISTLNWYRMYCVGRLGKGKADYIAGFESVKRDFDRLFEMFDDKDDAGRIIKPVITLLGKIDSILKSRRLTDERIKQIGTLLWDFISKEEEHFRSQYLEYCLARDATREYSKELYDAVAPLLKEFKYDAAVLAAFKYLESHLQTTLGVSPYEYYGEALVNYALSPNSGVLQLGTGPNEQVGIRNFFSGANALFRNPSAHRFVDYDDFDAEVIIAMVAMMVHIVTVLQKRATT